jgi:hypothetical protein
MSQADRHLSDLSQPRGVAAIVATVNTAARTVTVKVRGWDDGAETHGPAPYMPHPEGGEDAVTHPVRGTRCLLYEDDQGGLWVPVWRYTT